MTPPLNLPTQAADLAGFAQDLASFTVDHIADVLGPRAVAGLDREDVLPARMQAVGSDPCRVLIRCFLLGEAVTEADLRLALPNSFEQTKTWGLVSGNEELRAAVDLRPTTIGNRNVWLAADLAEIATGKQLDADHVLGLGGASATLVDLTVRTPVQRALDVGAGSGIQTLGLTPQAAEVVATDISPRALQFAAFNLALNEAMAPELPSAAVQLLQGSFFEPIDGDFDLIVSNPPFVVSPRGSSLDTYTYRDGGYVGDGVVMHLIENLPTYLRPGGVAQLLANWEVHQGQEWSERITQVLRATGCDAWAIQRELVDPAHYVHTWLRDGGLTPERDRAGYERAYEQWVKDFDDRGVTHIAFGYITLRKPAQQRTPWVRVEENTGTISSGLGTTIAATLEMVDTLEHTSDEELLTWVCDVPADVTEERYYRPGAADPNVILLRQGGGFGRAVHMDTLGAAVVGACDGELSIGQICHALAHLLEVEAQAIMDDVLPTLRGLLTDGLIIVSDKSGNVAS